MAERLRAFLATVVGTFFWTGFFPYAPGTFTSLAALACYLAFPLFRDPLFLSLLVLASSAAGVWAGGVMERRYGEDPSCVTIDEAAGQWLALLFLPGGVLPAVLSFIFFRFFDIAKPGLVDAAQRLPGGYGIMADDLLSGLFANLATRLALLLLPAGLFLS